MSYMTINNRRVTFTNERNVLSVIRKSGIDLPTFCYHSELSTYGACRMCVVEDDRGKIFASCSEVPRDGMVILREIQTGNPKRPQRLETPEKTFLFYRAYPNRGVKHGITLR